MRTGGLRQQPLIKTLKKVPSLLVQINLIRELPMQPQIKAMTSLWQSPGVTNGTGLRLPALLHKVNRENLPLLDMQNN